MAKGKRYRSMRKKFYMNLPDGRRILFSNHRYPDKNHPACTDPVVIAHISAKLGDMIWEETDVSEIIVNPQAVPDDCEAAHLQNAARFLAQKGFNINPKLLESGEREAEAPLLPSKGAIREGKKSELVEIVEKFGWEIDTNQKVPDLKAAILAVIEELSE